MLKVVNLFRDMKLSSEISNWNDKREWEHQMYSYFQVIQQNIISNIYVMHHIVYGVV